MSEERPLDSLLPEMTRPDRRADAGDIDARAIHPRVLEVSLDDHREWAMSCWLDVGPDVLTDQLGGLVGGVLLGELSRPSTAAVVDRNFEAIQLLVFAELAEPSAAAVESLGFDEVDYVADQYTERMETWRDEARRMDLAIPGQPAAVYAADLVRPEPPIANKLADIESQMVDKLDAEPWGTTPGGPSRLLARYTRQYFNTTIKPNRQGLADIELLYVQQNAGAIRWMSPVFFQAICDFVGVVLQADHGLDVQWGVSTLDDDGLAAAPLFRIPGDAEPDFVSVGAQVIERCVMATKSGTPALPKLVDTILAELH